MNNNNNIKQQHIVSAAAGGGSGAKPISSLPSHGWCYCIEFVNFYLDDVSAAVQEKLDTDNDSCDHHGDDHCTCHGDDHVFPGDT